MKSPKKKEFLFSLETPPPKGGRLSRGGSSCMLFMLKPWIAFLQAVHLKATQKDDPPVGSFLHQLCKTSTLQDSRWRRGTGGITELTQVNPESTSHQTSKPCTVEQTLYSSCVNSEEIRVSTGQQSVCQLDRNQCLDINNPCSTLTEISV